MRKLNSQFPHCQVQKGGKSREIHALSSLAENSHGGNETRACCQLSADRSLVGNESRLYFNLKQWSKASTGLALFRATLCFAAAPLLRVR